MHAPAKLSCKTWLDVTRTTSERGSVPVLTDPNPLIRKAWITKTGGLARALLSVPAGGLARRCPQPPPGGTYRAPAPEARHGRGISRSRAASVVRSHHSRRADGAPTGSGGCLSKAVARPSEGRAGPVRGADGADVDDAEVRQQARAVVHSEPDGSAAAHARPDCCDEAAGLGVGARLQDDACSGVA